MAQVEKVSLTHEALMQWMILNPEKSMKECAKTFGYTQSWLSSVINSGCFQARLAEVRGEVVAATALTLPEKLTSIATVALDNVARHIETNTDPDFNLKVLDTALGKLGFGAAKSGVIVNNTQKNIYLGTREDLDKARQLINKQTAQLPAPSVEAPAIEIVEAQSVVART